LAVSLPLAGAVGAVLMAQGLELLELVRGEDGGELLAGALLDGAHLLVPVLRSQVLVLPEGGQLLVAVGEDGLELLAVWSGVRLSTRLMRAASCSGLGWR
jgi:hypothetical protein